MKLGLGNAKSQEKGILISLSYATNGKFPVSGATWTRVFANCSVCALAWSLESNVEYMFMYLAMWQKKTKETQQYILISIDYICGHYTSVGDLLKYGISCQIELSG